MNGPLKDNGTRHTFTTGAVREVPSGKGRFDLIPYHPLLRLARHYENGAKKYAPRNWQKGLPLSNFLGALARHTFQLMEGDTSEDHAAAVAWNIFGFMWTEDRIKRGLLPPELNDLEPLPVWVTPAPVAPPPFINPKPAPFADDKTLDDYIKRMQQQEKVQFVNALDSMRSITGIEASGEFTRLAGEGSGQID